MCTCGWGLKIRAMVGSQGLVRAPLERPKVRFREGLGLEIESLMGPLVSSHLMLGNVLYVRKFENSR